eukprot:PhM_4_TR18818/c2_g4_i1/m.35819
MTAKSSDETVGHLMTYIEQFLETWTFVDTEAGPAGAWAMLRRTSTYRIPREFIPEMQNWIGIQCLHIRDDYGIICCGVCVDTTCMRAIECALRSRKDGR